MNSTQSARRQRPDGTWTFTSEDWDAKWYWPVGTPVSINGESGTVTKTNSVSVTVRGASGRVYARIPVKQLVRL